MKFNIILFLSCALLVSLMTSCQKEDGIEPETVDLTSVEDLSTGENLFLDIEQMEDAELEFRSGECVTVTFVHPKGTFPNTVIIDYGEGCEGPNGRVRSGKIIVNQSVPMGTEGAERVTTLKNFFIDAIQLKGVKTLVNLGLDESGNTQFSRNIANGQLIFPGGKMTTFQGEHTRIQIAGADTPDDLMDDIFEITGSASGSNRNGATFSSTIIEPLVKPRSCMYQTEGIAEVTFSIWTATIDYGDGSCDNLMSVLLPNGETRQVQIHKKWWM